jgi:signal transduction histidine kinase
LSRSSTKEFFSSADPLSERWVDLRLIAGMRLALASTTFFITLIDPSVTNRFASPTFTALAVYTLYGLALYLLSLRHSPIVTHKALPWLDLFYYLLLITGSNGTNSIFFYFFFFPIFVASFGWGLTAGLRLTLAAALLFTVVGYLTAKPPMELNRFLMRPIQLLVFGYMIARWGGYKIELKNRLQLLKDMTIFSNPRFGIDRTIKSILESLRAFYDADACLLIVPGRENDGSRYQLYRVTRETHVLGTPPREMNGDAVGVFLLPAVDLAVIYRKNGQAQTLQFDLKTHEMATDGPVTDDRVASVLEASSYLSVPIQYRNQPRGRMYIIGGPHRFAGSDLDFVVQLMDQVAPVMENIRLVDHLASDAADQERRRLARDIHDSVIQPYLGLQFGVAAVRKKLEDGNPTALKDVNELLELTTHELAELRRYVGGLRAGEERRDVLLSAIERFATRFSAVTGIHVDVQAQGKIEVNDRLAAELFQIVTEGLSNVRRHAFSSDARVEIFYRNGLLVLEIKNRRSRSSSTVTPKQDGSSEGNVSFNPRSISERAALLGGETKVSIDESNYTVVSVRIPV